MNVSASNDVMRLTPLPKSAAAATRCSPDGSSSGTTGTRSRIQSVAGPASMNDPATNRCSTPSLWNAE